MGFRDKFLVLRCTAEKSSYLPRPAPRQGTLTGLDLYLRLRLRSPKCFSHVPTSRVAGWNDFLQGLASLISPREEPGFEAFPAVYRAPSLFWHRPGYVFPGVHGRPCHPKVTDTFTIPYLAFHAPVGLPTGLWLSPEGLYLAARRVVWTTHCGRSRDSSVYRGLSAGPRVFLPFGSHDPSDLLFAVLPRNGSDSVGSIGFRRSPLSALAAGLTVAVQAVPMFSEPIWRSGFSSAGVAHRPWTASLGVEPSSSIGLDSSGLPVGGRIPPGGYPSPRCSSIAGGL